MSKKRPERGWRPTWKCVWGNGHYFFGKRKYFHGHLFCKKHGQMAKKSYDRLMERDAERDLFVQSFNQLFTVTLEQYQKTLEDNLFGTSFLTGGRRQ